MEDKSYSIHTYAFDKVISVFPNICDSVFESQLRLLNRVPFSNLSEMSGFLCENISLV